MRSHENSPARAQNNFSFTKDSDCCHAGLPEALVQAGLDILCLQGNHPGRHVCGMCLFAKHLLIRGPVGLYPLPSHWGAGGCSGQGPIGFTGAHGPPRPELKEGGEGLH